MLEPPSLSRNCRCVPIQFKEPDMTRVTPPYMIHARSVARREPDGKLFATVRTLDVPTGVEHSFTFDDVKGGLVQAYPSFANMLAAGDEWPRQHKDATVRALTWVRLDDICPVKVLHVMEYEGHIAAVVDARDVPAGVPRSRARWFPVHEFIAEVHPAEAKEAALHGPTDRNFGEAYCWLFLDTMFADSPARALTEPVSCGYTAPEPTYDGLTRAQCFERYAEAMRSERMREDGTGARGTLLNIKVGELALTGDQLFVAQEEWAARLNAKVEESHYAAQAADAAVVGWDPYEGDDL